MEQTILSPVTETNQQPYKVSIQKNDTTKTKQFRKELLEEVDGEINTAETKLIELNSTLNEAKAKLDQQIQGLHADIGASVEFLKQVTMSLEDILTQEGLSDDPELPVSSGQSLKPRHRRSQARDGELHQAAYHIYAFFH